MKRLFLVENGISKNENDFPMALLLLPMVTWLFCNVSVLRKNKT